MRVSLPVVLVALLLFIGLPPAASASDVWCDTDPVIVFTTPAGRLVPLYVNTGALGLEHLPAAQLANVTYTVSPAKHGTATNVKVEVLVSPDAFGDSFRTRTGVSTLPFQTGTVYARRTGHAGHVMSMQFVLPYP